MPDRCTSAPSSAEGLWAAVSALLDVPVASDDPIDALGVLLGTVIHRPGALITAVLLAAPATLLAAVEWRVSELQPYVLDPNLAEIEELSAIRSVASSWASRHCGQDKAILRRRVAVYEAARQRHPRRWAPATCRTGRRRAT